MREYTNKIAHLELDKDDMFNTFGKVVVLLYCYLGRYPTFAFSLVADQAYIIQNGIRILRALFEVTLTNMWSELSE